jgi:flagellar basal-body rod modification protein FlgD
MNVNLLTAANPASQTASAASSATDTNDMFLQLLVTQLKSQSPLDPVDPNQFVGQLVQFNTLDQIVRIRELLEQGSSVPAGSFTSSIQGEH